MEKDKTKSVFHIIYLYEYQVDQRKKPCGRKKTWMNFSISQGQNFPDSKSRNDTGTT